MPSDFRWHFFLVSAGYLPDTYVGAEDNRKGIPFVKIVSLLCKLIQFLMVALSVTVHKALILLVFLNHPYQSLAFVGFPKV